MFEQYHKRKKRDRRRKRVRAKVKGTSERPRLSVFRSHKHVWAQLIDDTQGKTIAAAGDMEIKSKIKSKKSEKPKEGRRALAGKVGELIAEKALKKKITTAVFDRGGYGYHGIVRAVAEGARGGGLKF